MEPKGVFSNKKIEQSEQTTTLKEALQKEGLENFPPVEISFSFAPHLTKNDAKAVRQRLTGIDIALIEEDGWTPQAPEIYNDLSQGKRSLKSTIEDLGYTNASFIEFNTELLRTLQQRGSSLYIHPFDMPVMHPSYEKYRKGMEENLIMNSDLILHKSPLPSYEDARMLFQEAARFIAAEHKEREEIAVQQLPRILAKAAARRPSFLKNSAVKALVIYGSAHELLKTRIAQAYPDVKIGGSYVDQTSRSALARYTEKLANSDPGADESLPAAFHYFVATIVAEKLYEHTSGINAAKYSEEIASALSDADARGLYEQFVIWRDTAGATTKLNSLLQAKGLPSINDPQAIKSFYRDKN